MRPGVRIGVDVGSVRIGLAACDRDGLLATPLSTLTRDPGAAAGVAGVAAAQEAVEVVVGLPRSLSGAEGPAAQGARAFAAEVAALLPAGVPVRLVDERLSTVSALAGRRAAGVSEKRGRSTLDQVAAVIILQSALDAERATGTPPGETVQVGA